MTGPACRDAKDYSHNHPFNVGQPYRASLYEIQAQLKDLQPTRWTVVEDFAGPLESLKLLLAFGRVVHKHGIQRGCQPYASSHL